MDCMPEMGASCFEDENSELEAIYKLGIEYLKENDMEKLVSLWTKALKYNDSRFYLSLAMYYLYKNTEDSSRKGMELLHKAADELNCDLCQFELGNIYFSGADGSEPDIMKAHEYWCKAAEQGNKEAMYKLGYSEKGERLGLAELADTVEGIEGAAINLMLGMIYYHGDVEAAGVSENLFRSFFDSDMAVERDVSKALFYIQRAIDMGYSQAKLQLGIIYLIGEDGVIEPDREKGIGLIAEAASEGSKDALDLLLELDEDDFDGDEDEAGDDGENGESE
ncbi:sel1 repeat family protein [bacterium]|nr:sel1 repeat family protein [bacterium]